MRARGRTLAEGRPGTEEPISEAGADEGQPDSIAATDEPYARSKLSGAEPDRPEETLAGGRAGSSRPISEAD